MTGTPAGQGARLRILAVSGSLRTRSSDTSLLRLAIEIAPDGINASPAATHAQASLVET